VTPVAFRSVSKSYPVYKRPSHRLLDGVSFNRWKRHDDYWAVRDVSFEVGKGDVFCLVGENGSGKSTTLQLAAQIFPLNGQAARCSGKERL
jgi:ABC-type polysaccharide/polyol phosphate transport system ATPase subunit